MLKRLWNLVKGFFGLFVGGLEKNNPEALLEAAKNEFKDKMTHYRTALAQVGGLADTLKVQINAKSAKAVGLERRIMANYQAGNSELAASLARELQDITADIETDKQEFAAAEESYQTSIAQIKEAHKAYQDRVSALERKLSQVKIKEAQAQAASALNGVSFKVGDLGDSMKSVEEALDKRYQESAGKARIAHDLVDTDAIKATESERKALEQNALANFLASKGMIAPKPVAALPEAEKVIGIDEFKIVETQPIRQA